MIKLLILGSDGEPLAGSKHTMEELKEHDKGIWRLFESGQVYRITVELEPAKGLTTGIKTIYTKGD